MLKKFWTITILIFILVSLVGCSNVNISKNDQTDFKQLYEKSIQDQAPLIKDIKFDGKVINNNEWCEVGNKVHITITLEGACQEVDLFITPTGSGVYKEQKLIEVVTPNKNIAEYVWEVPQDTMVAFNIIAYNKNVGRRSDLYNVISKNSTNN
ncbi:hypothetical protein [Desulfitobacterium sp.]|uniref:hypothetical protein n=1 Tax=Desulfitobacterium sp. TaxID=49981 RepID=UPI002B90932A|nr:hypothetical protein [Desulfitobacterium sp.]HVJ49722.1 hypothetical protein [Desulfitobacterium sp.]